MLSLCIRCLRVKTDARRIELRTQTQRVFVCLGLFVIQILFDKIGLMLSVTIL